MTGFARVRRATVLGEVIISLRAVNHRTLDLHFHLPPDIEPYESALRKLLATSIIRGHIDVRATLAQTRGHSTAEFNSELLAAWITAFRKLSAEHGLTGEPDLNAASRIPGMIIETAGEEPGGEFEAQVLAAVAEAADTLNAERAREGAATREVLLGYAGRILEHAAAMETVRSGVATALQQRMLERMRELLATAGIDPARLAQEAAIQADRSEIAEETTRLAIHAKQLLDMLAQGGELGKKVEFLLQEMQREANTILSKANGAGDLGRRITDLGLAVKSDIEKLREQSLNLE